MMFRRNPGTALALLIAAHPLQAAMIAGGVAVVAALAGRPLRDVGLVFLTVLVGRFTAGWLNDVADRDRDMAVERADKPIAREWLHPSTVTFTVACATLLLVPLSLSNGYAAGAAHLASVVAAWLYNTRLKLTWASWIPWALSFGLLPAFVTYGGWGGGWHGGPPTVTVTILAALLGVGVHLMDALPDLVGDHHNEVRSLPVRLALRLGAVKLLWLSGTFTALVLAGLVVAGLTVGLER